MFVKFREVVNLDTERGNLKKHLQYLYTKKHIQRC
jgi:hypothetical protein